MIRASPGLGGRPLWPSVVADTYHWGVLSTFSVARPQSRVVANLFLHLLSRSIRTRYRGSVLGIFWTLLNPAAMMLIYTVVFSTIVRVQVGGPYVVFLLAGLVPWIAFSQGLQTASVSVIANAPLVKKVYFRLELLPITEVVTAGVNLLISLGLVVVGVVVYRHGLDFPLIALPLLVALQLLFTVALGMILAAATCYFRDVEYLLNLTLIGLFYATPIIYPLSLVEHSHHARLYQILAANPLSWLAGAYQDVLFHDTWPQPAALAGFIVVTAAAGLVAWLVFSKARPHLAEEL